MTHSRSSTRRRIVLVLAAVALLPLPAAATKPQPAVVGHWHRAPSSVPLGQIVNLTLRVQAAENTPDVIVEVVPTAGVEIVSGDRRWTRALSAGEVLDLPVTVRFIADGEWTLGASITNRRPEAGIQVSGAVLSVQAKSGIATLSNESLAALNLSSAQTPEDRRRLGVAREPSKPPPARRRRSPS